MKNFKVSIWFGVERTELVLSASNQNHAINIAKKVYPQGRVVGAKEVK